MKKNKKGFTLVELLAVVIILIIIILIAVSAIRRNVDKTLDNTIKANAGAYIKAVNSFVEVESIGTASYDDGLFTISQLEEAGVKVSGTKPNDGMLLVSKRRVSSGCLVYDDYHVNFTSGEVLEPEKGPCGEGSIVFNYDYTGREEIWTVPISGHYKLEVWGAQGGSSSYNSSKAEGGYGGYSVGTIYLNQGETFYINVGGKGNSVTYNQTSADISYDSSTGYNGGGYSGVYNDNSSHAGGGGATSIAKESGLLSQLKNSVSNIVIVAGGGGGASTHASYPSYSGTGGSGGGYTGGNGVTGNTTCYHYGTGATQTSVGSIQTCTNDSTASRNEQATNNLDFGMGSNYISNTSGAGYAYSGGGAGLYGGQSGYHAPGSGGSGFIGYALLENSKMKCYNCSETTIPYLKTEKTTCADGNAKEDCAKKGNGYAKITYLDSNESTTDVKFLYSSGNEYVENTGGWTLYNGQNNGRSEKLYNSIRIYCSAKSNSHSSTNTAQNVDSSGYTKLNVVYQIASYSSANDYGKLGISINGSGAYYNSYATGVYLATANINSNSISIGLYDYDVDIRILQVWLSN